MAEITEQGRFWRLGNLRLIDYREAEQLSFECARLRKDNQILADAAVRMEEELKRKRKAIARVSRDMHRYKELCHQAGLL